MALHALTVTIATTTATVARLRPDLTRVPATVPTTFIPQLHPAATIPLWHCHRPYDRPTSASTRRIAHLVGARWRVLGHIRLALGGANIRPRPGKEKPMGFDPYLAFAGNCRDAFTRYQEIFGGELVLLTMGDAPADAGSAEGTDPNAIMHAALTTGEDTLMGADAPAGGFDGSVRGMCVSISMADVGEAKRVFDALADGGNLQMPLGETFFSPAFGMCIDRFGTPWMVSADAPTAD
jgi:PhnB protein